MQYFGIQMLHPSNITAIGYNELAEDKEIPLIPVFIPDNIGPWVLKYMWILKKDDPNFINKYHNTALGTKNNVRKTTDYLGEHWRAFNSVIVNNGHLGNIVWRIKLTNTYSRTIDIVEVWRSKEILDNIFSFTDSDTVEIEQATTINSEVSPSFAELSKGGTGLKNGTGLTINDDSAPKIYTLNNKKTLAEGLWYSGFDMRIWNEYPLISKELAIDIFYQLKKLSESNPDIKINTGYNLGLNSV